MSVIRPAPTTRRSAGPDARLLCCQHRHVAQSEFRPFEFTFMKDQQANLDFAFEANPEVADVAKHILAHYYSGPAAFSYFVGCSTSGREALILSQRYPTTLTASSSATRLCAPAAPTLRSANGCPQPITKPSNYHRGLKSTPRDPKRWNSALLGGQFTANGSNHTNKTRAEEEQ